MLTSSLPARRSSICCPSEAPASVAVVVGACGERVSAATRFDKTSVFKAVVLPAFAALEDDTRGEPKSQPVSTRPAKRRVSSSRVAEGGGVEPHSRRNVTASNGTPRPLGFAFRGGKPRSRSPSLAAPSRFQRAPVPDWLTYLDGGRLRCRSPLLAQLSGFKPAPGAVRDNRPWRWVVVSIHTLWKRAERLAVAAVPRTVNPPSGQLLDDRFVSMPPSYPITPGRVNRRPLQGGGSGRGFCCRACSCAQHKRASPLSQA